MCLLCRYIYTWPHTNTFVVVISSVDSDWFVSLNSFRHKIFCSQSKSHKMYCTCTYSTQEFPVVRPTFYDLGYIWCWTDWSYSIGQNRILFSLESVHNDFFFWWYPTTKEGHKHHCLLYLSMWTVAFWSCAVLKSTSFLPANTAPNSVGFHQCTTPLCSFFWFTVQAVVVSWCFQQFVMSWVH